MPVSIPVRTAMGGFISRQAAKNGRIREATEPAQKE